MDHSQVAIQTDTAQEADADVDVLVEQEAAQLTQPLPVAPVVTLERTRRRVRHKCVKVESAHVQSGILNTGREPANPQELLRAWFTWKKYCSHSGRDAR